MFGQVGGIPAMGVNRKHFVSSRSCTSYTRVQKQGIVLKQSEGFLEAHLYRSCDPECNVLEPGSV